MTGEQGLSRTDEPPTTGAGSEQSADDAEQVLAWEVRGCRIDRLLGPVLLVTAVVLAVIRASFPEAFAGAWSWALLAPAGFALVKAAGAGWSLWRRRAWRSTDLDRVGTTRVTRVRTDVAAGTVASGDRLLAARMLVNEGALFCSQGWVMTGLAGGQIVLAGADLDGVRIGLSVVALGLAAFAFWHLNKHHSQAVRLLAAPVGLR